MPKKIKLTSREWGYWTTNKLQILSDYLPAFTRASQSADKTVYIDLMSGSVENVEKHSGKVLDGSPTIALKTNPAFSSLILCELPGKAEALNESLNTKFPGRDITILAGDCNETHVHIPEILKSKDLTWAPMFIFIDQHAAEVSWKTIAAMSKLKPPRAKSKPELWILISPSLTIRGAAEKATKSEDFRARVDDLYGTPDWRRILQARAEKKIEAKEYRDEMVNLFRWRLESELGYKQTHHINMVTDGNVPIYDMIFATDHTAGSNIMKWCYAKAAEREPQMRQEARGLRIAAKDNAVGKLALFEADYKDSDLPPGEWAPSPAHPPEDLEWWDDYDTDSVGY